MIKFQSFLSSSSGNATFVTDDKTSLLVDCGANGKYIAECMRRISVPCESLAGILVTHEHQDHIGGIGVLSRKYNIPIYATPKTWDAIGASVGKISNENKRITEKEMTFGNITVRSFSIPHDAADPVGYSFITDDHKFTIATDLGHITEEVYENLCGSHAVIIEANHDVEMLMGGKYPFHLKKRILGDLGHLSNECCGELCARLAKNGTCSFWLGHLSAENNLPEVAYKTVVDALHNEGYFVGNGFSLNVLPKSWISQE